MEERKCRRLQTVRGQGTLIPERCRGPADRNTGPRGDIPVVNAQKDYLKSFFQGTIRYVVPFYQRAYVWEEDNWDVLWDNLWQLSIDVATEKTAEHFIGTLITKQRRAQSIDDNSFDLIDGQQRLTSITLLLKAIADSTTGELPNLRSFVSGLLAFQDARGRHHYRIEHNRVDGPHFEAILSGTEGLDAPPPEHRLGRAYRYFLAKVQGLTDEQRETLVNVIVSRVAVISMLLSETDDEQVIFDTINSLGVKLTTAELLKNYIFKEPKTRSLYDSHWQNVFEADDDLTQFWNANKTAGRLLRANIEVLMYCYLIMTVKREVRLDRLFKEYKDWLQDKDVDQRVDVLIELKELAEIYFGLPAGDDLAELRFREHEKRFFYVIDNLNITTAYPLILFLYRNFHGEVRIQQLRVLESYLVRRNLCRLTTKNYNNLFISLLQKLDEKRLAGDLTPQSLYDLLVGFNDATNLFPVDTAVTQAFSGTLLSNQHARVILFAIALHQQDSDLHDSPKLSPSSYSVEHIMPKAWEAHWSSGEMTRAAKDDRSGRILTLGNLTLVTKRLNSSLRNGPWSEKRETLRKFSSLRMTTEYLKSEEWSEETIQARGSDLAAEALTIWSRSSGAV
jgi:uncharacterized protein with ParB-like and HNH nuclease domain